MMALKGSPQVSGGKHINLGKSAQKSKAAHPVNYFPGFLGKNIKNCPIILTYLPECSKYF